MFVHPLRASVRPFLLSWFRSNSFLFFKIFRNFFNSRIFIRPRSFTYRPIPTPKKTPLGQIENFKHTQQFHCMCKRFQTFFEDQTFCDVTLVSGIDDVRIETHRLILAACSDYFYAMFSGWSMEARTREVVLDTIDGPLLRVLLNFMYTGEIEIRVDNVENLLSAANIFQMQVLIEQCCTFMMNRLEASNCLGIAFYSEQHNQQALQEVAYALACDCFTDLHREEEFFQMEIDQFIKFVSSDDICVDSEEDVFQAIKRWIARDLANREIHLHKLIAHLRFPVLKRKFIETEVSNFCKTDQCQELIAKALEEHTEPVFKNTRNSKQKILYVSIRFVDERVLSSEVYSPVLGRWLYQEWRDKPSNRSIFGALVSGDKLLIAGGKLQNFAPTDIFELFSLKTLQWTPLSSMNTRRVAFGMAELNGDIYAVGGRNDCGVMRTAERYSFITGRWEDIAAMWEKRCDHAVVAMDGLLYVVGGAYSFECFNPRTNSWTRKAAMRDGLSPAGAAVVNGKLYAINLGGNMIQLYDPDKDAWEDISELAVQTDSIQCTAIGDCMIVNCGNFLIKEFNTITGEWRNLPPFTKLCGKGILLTV